MKYVVGTQSHSFKREGCTSHHILRFLFPTGLTEEAYYLEETGYLSYQNCFKTSPPGPTPPYFKLAFTALRTLKY